MNFMDINNSIFSSNDSSGFLFGSLVFVILTIRAFFSLNKTKELRGFFSNPKTIGNFVLIIVWCYMIYSFVGSTPNKKQAEKLKNATKKAMIALLIAFFSKMDLVIAPFWLVWLVAYYLEDWV
jgi:hypothetical protein